MNILSYLKNKSGRDGIYLNSFYEIQLPTNANNPDFKSLKGSDLAFLLHEYIHYMQDIMTIDGFYTTYVISEYIHGAVTLIRQRKNVNFAIPYSIPNDYCNIAIN